MNPLWQALFRSWHKHFLMQLATLTVLTASFTIVIFFLTVSMNMQRLLSDWGDNVQMTAYLKEDLDIKQINDVEKILKSYGKFDKVSFISKKDAMADFSKQLSSYAPDLLADGGFENSFPASFQLFFAKGSPIQYPQLVKLASQVGQIGGIEDVSYGQGWVQNYSKFIEGLAAIGWSLVAVLLLGAIFVIANSIRTNISQRREEIEILELIGATAAMIRKPYIFEGVVMGLLAIVASLILNYGLYLVQKDLVSSSWSMMGLAQKFNFMSWWMGLLLLVTGGLVGGLGAYLTVMRLNSGWSASRRLGS